MHSVLTIISLEIVLRALNVPACTYAHFHTITYKEILIFVNKVLGVMYN